jgi:hypothetical protein
MRDSSLVSLVMTLSAQQLHHFDARGPFSVIEIFAAADGLRLSLPLGDEDRTLAWTRHTRVLSAFYHCRANPGTLPASGDSSFGASFKGNDYHPPAFPAAHEDHHHSATPPRA